MSPAKEFRFVTQKVFSIPGQGIVVSGRVERGGVAVGDEIAFMATDGRMVNALVLAIEVGRKLVQETAAGQDANLLLEGPRKDQIAVGTVFTEAQEIVPPPVSYAPTGPASVSLPEAPRMPSMGGAIEPSSGSLRMIFFILLGILILLGLLFLEGKWEPHKRFTAVGEPQPAAAAAENHGSFSV